MGWQPKSEKDDERKLLTDFANKFKFPIVKLYVSKVVRIG